MREQGEGLPRWFNGSDSMLPKQSAGLIPGQERRFHMPCRAAKKKEEEEEE